MSANHNTANNHTVLRFGTFSFRLTITRIILILAAAIGGATMIYRLIKGIGPATNLNDSWPFGLWIGVDVMLGVALAAGGFTMCAIVYVFNLKEFKPLAKPAVLTAWLGYLLVVIGLGMDVGLWYNWWRPIFHWGYTSVLFEVFICVMLYNVVLLVEFLPVLSKRLNWKKAYEFSTAVALPAVIGGVMLSSLHQSSLGALFLLMPDRLNPLWYTELLPWLFLLSAIAVGPAMVIVESYLSSRAYNMEFEDHILRKLAMVVAVISSLYVFLKLFDLQMRGYLTAMFNGTLASNMFLVEMALFIIPVLIVVFGLFSKPAKNTVAVGASVVIGVIVNRLNVLFTGLYESAHMSYFPAVTEFAVSFGIIAMGCLAYLFFVENFDVFDREIENNPYVQNEKEQGTVGTGVTFGSK